MINQDFLNKYGSRMKEAVDYHKALNYLMAHGFSRKHAKKMIKRGKKSIAKHIKAGNIEVLAKCS